MATIREVSAVVENTEYYLVRRAQASIAGYRHFDEGDLVKYLERDSFQALAGTLVEKYFHCSKDLVLADEARDLYMAHLVMAPILQRLPLSVKYDWHRGHLVSFFRTNAGNRVKRFHFRECEIVRSYQPELLTANLDLLGVHDGGMVEVLRDLYRRHAGGTTLKHQLAHQLFDPIMMMNLKQGYELRHGNRLYRLEKDRFESSIDLRRESAKISDFQFKSVEHAGGCHLEIMVSAECLNRFREKITSIIMAPASPDYKMVQFEDCIRDFVEKIRPARTAQPQVMELKKWLANKLRRLAGTKPEMKVLPNMLVNCWQQRVDNKLHVKVPNFFLDPSTHSKRIYLKLFSPYREV